MTLSPALVQLFQSISLVGIVTFLVNIVAPFLERYAPFAKPDSSTHDATLRLLNLLLNVGLALGAAAAFGQLTDGPAILTVIGYGIAQATGSHVLYASGNRSTPATTVASVAAAPVASLAALAALAAPSSANVANAVNQAIVDQNAKAVATTGS